MTEPEPTVTLPVAFLSMMHYEDCQMGPKGLHLTADTTPWWFRPTWPDGEYTTPVRPAEPDEIEAQRALDDAINALIREAGG